MVAPLEGLKVVDIGWLMVGPVSARYLADLGADTIKLETARRLDPLRGLGPFKDGEAGPERTVSYHMINANKRGLAIDAKSPDGLAIIRKLVANADVFIESFTPGAIDELGLSYDVLSRENPRLIMVSTGILGRKGTMGIGMSGTGMTGSAYAGATNLVGWPDRPPVGPYGPWTDAVAPRFLVASVLAALHRRRETGRGVYIDLAQAEAGLQFLGPAYLNFAVNGVVTQRAGTIGSSFKAPFGAYACSGEDEWIVIDADTPEAWMGLRTLLEPALDAPEFATLVGRLRSRAQLDAHISDWARSRDAAGAEAQLQAAGVPAHLIANDHNLAFDTDLEASGFHRRIEDPVIGEMWVTGPQFTLTKTAHRPTCAGPRIGDSTETILEQELGFSRLEIERLKRDGVLG
jgi:benzylsuccinate CoA-transferase BbsF subunit